ncbi:FAD-dependent monooxygenase [Streptomyces sp. NPDC021056]|uniref:FAD-dependent monooxygenase n=1 Tax=Streptomyces sp. NPDC021056 TaxID=3155012 RepID=UPI0033F1C25B
MAYQRLEADVVVVGGGPVGLMLAGELRLGGADVVVLETREAPTTESRASTLHARTMEILDSRGLLQAFGTPPCEVRGHFGGIPLDLTLPSTHPGQWKVPQTETERLLQDWAAGLGARIKRCHTLRALRTTGEGVEAVAAGPGGPVRIRAAYLVGCDGENSTVRRLLGADFPGEDAHRELLRADVAGIDVPNRRFQRLERGMAVAARRGDGVTRVMVHEFGREAKLRTREPDFAEVCEVWQRVTGEDITSGTPLWVNSFGDANRQLSAYRHDRVLFAGDAAHRQMPIGGQALNLGLQDAVNLGWKLAAVATGRAPADVLDTYHAERHEVGRRVLANIKVQSQLLLGGPESNSTRALFAELLPSEKVRTHLASMIAGLDISYGDQGVRLPRTTLTTGDRQYTTTELLHPARPLLLLLTPEAAPFHEQAAPWSDYVTTLTATADLPGTDAVLLRPDGHIAWMSPSDTPLPEALTHWFGPPTTQRPTADDVRTPSPVLAPKSEAAALATGDRATGPAPESIAAPRSTSEPAAADGDEASGPAPAPESIAAPSPAPEPAVADGDSAPQGPPAPESTSRTGGAGGTPKADGEAEAANDSPKGDPMNTKDHAHERYDVAILGAGMAGGMLGAVLARNGVKVLLIDAGTHPRFAVGESTIPYTSAMTRIVGERYEVPEIVHMASFRGIQDHVSPMSGRKQNFGFVYHREGQDQNPDEINQLVVPEWQRTESHLFRQDTDAYLFHLAVRYGATPLLGTRITDIETGPDGAVLRSDRGVEYRAEYLVDGSGFRSPVADAFGLREEPTRARHHSRTLFTHMVGVTPYDDAPSAAGHQQPSPWHHGTLHHVFDGGWLWVIPFDNHDGAINPLCSVGLTFDERKFPKSQDLSPQQEFDAFLARFPQIAEQFTDARAVRPWVATGRLQYSSSSTVGERYCLTAHAAGFIDALYSRGLTNTLEVVNSLAWRLIEASRDGDWSTERFEYIDRLQQGLYDVHDDLVYSSFVGFQHYDLWNAVTRVWESTSIMPTMTVERAYRRFMEDRDEQILKDLEQTTTPGLPAPVGEDISSLLTLTRSTCQAVEAGGLEPGEAAELLFEQLRESKFLPEPFALGDPANKCFEATPELLGQALEWGRTKAPEHIAGLFG